MHLTRRYFLKSSGARAAYLGVTPIVAMAGGLRVRPQPVAKGKTLVVVFLRGGAAGLNLVVPFSDPHYRRLRPTLAVGAPGARPGESRGAPAIDLDGRFGLHPRLAPLKPLFDDGIAVAAHAVGYAHNTRSHFEEQDTWETGVIGNTVGSDGWLNRHLATSEGRGPIRAVSIGDTLPRILHGPTTAYAIRGLSDLTLPAGAADPRVSPRPWSTPTPVMARVTPRPRETCSPRPPRPRSTGSSSSAGSPTRRTPPPRSTRRPQPRIASARLPA